MRFRFPFGARGPTVNAANPLVLGDHVFVSASYGVGASGPRSEPREATNEWDSDDVMSSQYTTCVEHDGILYGIDGRQDVGMARLRAFDPRTGSVLWTEEGFGTGDLILADGKLLIMKTDGELVLAEPSPEEFRPAGPREVVRDDRPGPAGAGRRAGCSCATRRRSNAWQSARWARRAETRVQKVMPALAMTRTTDSHSVPWL